MKKYISFIILMTVLMLTGCSKKDQMTNFIPTPIPESENDSEGILEGTEGDSDASGEDTDATPTPKPIHVGQTITMYVKMGEYDAVLNVRKTPSTDGEVVGFLVHTEKVAVIEIVDGWASFAKGNEICYVSAGYLVDVRPEYITPPSPAPSPTPANTPTPATPTDDPSAGNTTTTDPNEAPPEI